MARFFKVFLYRAFRSATAGLHLQPLQCNLAVAMDFLSGVWRRPRPGTSVHAQLPCSEVFSARQSGAGPRTSQNSMYFSLDDRQSISAPRPRKNSGLEHSDKHPSRTSQRTNSERLVYDTVAFPSSHWKKFITGVYGLRKHQSNRYCRDRKTSAGPTGHFPNNRLISIPSRVIRPEVGS
jgi:hypothetical protein